MEVISSWLEPTNSRGATVIKAQDDFIKSVTHEILECKIAYYDRYGNPFILAKVDDCEKIIQPAIYPAGDALLASFAEGGYFRGCFDHSTMEGLRVMPRCCSA
jgi:hypothetical protein